MSVSRSSKTRPFRIAVVLVASILVGLIPHCGLSALYDTTVSAQKASMCSSPTPATDCVGGIIGNSSCHCYTYFNIPFDQNVELEANWVDTQPCTHCGYFALWNKEHDKRVIDEKITSSGYNWTKTVFLKAGDYKLFVGDLWPGMYTVRYNKTKPVCKPVLSVSTHDFGKVSKGTCSSPLSVTFKNNGTADCTNVSVSSTVPEFVVDAGSNPGTVGPNGSFTFKVEFCAPSGLPQDKVYSGYIEVFTGSLLPPLQVAVFGTAHVPVGKLHVANSFYVGEADPKKPSPGNQVEAALKIENVGDATMSVTATLLDDGGGVFSLPGGGTVGTISGPGSAKVSIRATVAAETGYTGTLRVIADYGGGETEKADVTLTAKGYHPVPKLVIATPKTVEFGEVEEDYRFRQVFVIKNVGDAPLTFRMGLKDQTDPDRHDFEVPPSGMKGPINGGDEKAFEVVFHPKGTGSRELLIVIDNTNEEPSTSHTIHLLGEGVDPFNLATMLVLDRSGSMGSHLGSSQPRKIEVARDAALLYLELLQDPQDDWLGITKYNEKNKTVITLAPIGSNKSNAATVLKDIHGEFLPTGATGIGDAMLTASAEYANPAIPADTALSMILLTDGMENVGTPMATAKTSTLNKYPDLRIFSVGMGNPTKSSGPLPLDAVDSIKLEAVASDSDGFFQIVSSLEGKNRYKLEAFFFKCFIEATGKQSALDPTFLLSLSPDRQLLAEVEIAECDRDAHFLIISELLAYYPDLVMRLALEDPTGQLIDIGSSVGGIFVDVKSWHHYKLVRVKFPERSESHLYAGTWRLFFMGIPEEDIDSVADFVGQYPSYDGKLPIALMVGVGSDYRLRASLNPAGGLPGDVVHVQATTTEAWWPIPGASVTMSVEVPDGTIISDILYDDGLHGDGDPNDGAFGAYFPYTHWSGYYEFLIRSTGSTERGEIVVREAVLGTYIGFEREEFTSEPQGECWICDRIYDPLVRIALNGDLVPVLAESWEISQDGMTADLHLRQDVMLHDGNPFNADVVAWNLQRDVELVPGMLRPAVVGTKSIVDVEVLDEYTVRLFLARPDPLLLLHLADVGGIAAATETSEVPVGTGPYRVESLDADQFAALVANAEYWAGPPVVKTLEYLVIAEDAAREAALQAGEIDVMLGGNPQEYAVVQQWTDYIVCGFPGKFYVLGSWVDEYVCDPLADLNLAPLAGLERLVIGIPGWVYGLE